MRLFIWQFTKLNVDEPFHRCCQDPLSLIITLQAPSSDDELFLRSIEWTIHVWRDDPRKREATKGDGDFSFESFYHFYKLFTES